MLKSHTSIVLLGCYSSFVEKSQLLGYLRGVENSQLVNIFVLFSAYFHKSFFSCMYIVYYKVLPIRQ